MQIFAGRQFLNREPAEAKALCCEVDVLDRVYIVTWMHYLLAQGTTLEDRIQGVTVWLPYCTYEWEGCVLSYVLVCVIEHE